MHADTQTIRRAFGLRHSQTYVLILNCEIAFTAFRFSPNINSNHFPLSLQSL